MNDIFPLLLSAGGAAFVTAIVLGVKTLREGKIASEESIVKRLNEDAKQAHSDADIQRQRALSAEERAEEYRRERDQARELAALLRREMIKRGIDPDEFASLPAR